NNIVARCRQLVYASRQTCDLLENGNRDMLALSQQLLDEDRQNARELEKERERLQSLAMKEAQTTIKNSFDRQSSVYRILFPWLKVKPPQLVSIEFGSVKGIDSNVFALDGIDDLASYDQQLMYVRNNSHLYAGNIDAKLDDEDNNLVFKISSLSAP